MFARTPIGRGTAAMSWSALLDALLRPSAPPPLRPSTTNPPAVMSLPRLLRPPLAALPALRHLGSCSARVFRAPYSRRSLQTQTAAAEPLPPRGAGVHSSLTSPANETQRPGPLPPSPLSSSSSSSVPPTTPRTKLRPRKAAITLTPPAVQRLHTLLSQPHPKLIRIGVKNRGCSGLAYSLEYVDRAERFDELVTQDDVTVLVDSRALLSVIGSEMDWVEDRLSARFVFRNPNISEWGSFFFGGGFLGGVLERITDAGADGRRGAVRVRRELLGGLI